MAYAQDISEDGYPTVPRPAAAAASASPQIGDIKSSPNGAVQWNGTAWVPLAGNNDQPSPNTEFAHWDGTRWVPNGGGAGGSGGTADAGGAFDASGFQWPTYSGPTYTPSVYTPPPKFDYPGYVQPTLDEARKEPGYDFAFGEGRRAVEQGAANHGTFRTGGALKDLFSWGNRFADQNYTNVENRAENIYTLNRNNAAGNYLTNFGVGKDAFTLNSGENQASFDRNRLSALDTFNPTERQAEMSFQDLYNRWRDSLNANTQIATAGAGA